MDATEMAFQPILDSTLVIASEKPARERAMGEYARFSQQVQAEFLIMTTHAQVGCVATRPSFDSCARSSVTSTFRVRRSSIDKPDLITAEEGGSR